MASVRITPNIARHSTMNPMKFCVSAVNVIPSVLKSDKMKSYHILKKLSMFYPLNNLISPRIPSPNSTKYSIVYCPKSGIYWVTNSIIVVMIFIKLYP